MSATIYAKQVKPCEGEALSTFSPSWFIKTIEQAFYAFPVTLNESDIPKLEGMAACVSTKENPYVELMDLIRKWKSVNVYAVY